MSLTLDRASFDHDDSVPTPQPARDPGEASALARLSLASLLVGPAAIHLAMIPSHAAESAAEAIGFAVAGWMGALLGLGMLLRPSRRVVSAAGVACLAMIAVWVRSRTAGLPFGAHAGHKELATGIDLLSTGMEAAAVLLCGVLLLRPGFGRRLGLAGGVIGGAIAGFAMVATSVALAAPSARDHAAQSHGDDGAVPGSADATAAAGRIASDGHLHADPAAVAATATPLAGAAAVTPLAGVSDVGADGAATVGVGDDVVAGDGHVHGAPAPVAVGAPAGRCDLGFNPVSFWEETDVVHGGAATGASLVGTADLDNLIAETTKAGGEAKDAKVVAMLGQATDAEYDRWIQWLPTYVGSAHLTSGAPDDNSGHGGHLGPQPWTPMADQAECDQLTAELERARTVAMRYPHPTDAEAGGWTKVTGYVPGIAAHYMKFGIVDGTFDIDEPEMLLYDGTDAGASIVGLSYYMIHDSDYEPTQGFTGPNDHFHRHIGLCVNGTGVIGDSTTTDEECAARGGVKQGGTGGWMNHVWIVPGCASPWGMFSGASPLLELSLRDASGTDGGGCAGSKVRDRFDMTPGTVDNVPGVLVGKAADAT